MEILDKGPLDKKQTVPEKNLNVRKPGRTFMRSLTMDASNNQILIL